MAYGKWIGGFLGLITLGPLGALAGFALGSLFDAADGSSVRNHGGDGNGYGSYGNGSYANGAYGNQHDSYSGYSRDQQQQGQRNTFRFSLLVLASYIIKADGRVMHSEMNMVRNWLRMNFGEQSVGEGEQILRRLFEMQTQLGAEEYRDTVMKACGQLAMAMPYEQRIQLLHFLSMIAQADGMVTREEVAALKECAVGLGLRASDVDSMLNLSDGSTNLDAAYKVLGVAPTATDAECRKAYRKLALENHPDKVAALGEEVRRAAEKRFQEINAAKELVWKSRGM